jgi:hypothetical protein
MLDKLFGLSIFNLHITTKLKVRQTFWGIMTTVGKKLTQRVIAIVVIVAVLDRIGISPTVIAFFLVAGFLVWRVVRRSENNETQAVFDFYASAHEMLRDDQHSWYGFEIAEVIDRGERVLSSMSDAPPLVYFALGALYHRVGDHENAADHLRCVVDERLTEEHHRASPSPQLRRYVEMLRHVEREPSVAPQALVAIRSLERARRSRAGVLLAESTGGLQQISTLSGRIETMHARAKSSLEEGPWIARSSHRTLSSIKPPPPISEVLREVYDEKKSS